MENERNTVLALLATSDSRYFDLRHVAIHLGWTIEKVRSVLGLKTPLAK